MPAETAEAYTLRLPPEMTLTQLKRAALDRGMTIKDLMLAAIREYLAKETRPN